MTIPAELDNLLGAYRGADFYTLKAARLALVEYIQKDYQRGVKDGEQWAMRASAALQFKDPSAFKQECDDADELIRLLGLNPDQCRTDGGNINLMRVRTLLAELLAHPAPRQMPDMRVNALGEPDRNGAFEIPIPDDWYYAHPAPASANVIELDNALVNARTLLQKAQEDRDDYWHLLHRIEPYIDSIVCYASTCGEYEPNQIAVDLRAAIAKGNPA